VFAGYKGFLRKRWRELLATDSATFKSWLDLLAEAATEFLGCKDWRSSFVQDGLIGNRQNLSKRLIAYLAASAVHVATAPPQPTAEQVALCLPRKAQLHYPIWMHQPQGRKRWIFLLDNTTSGHKQKKKTGVASST
jgi:hypothetical protein